MFAVKSNPSNNKALNSNNNNRKYEKEKGTAAEAVAVKSVKATKPTMVKLNGIPVHFPFKPYQLQEDYMLKVINALDNSENALIESPTGTGKSLCLLCSSLAWQKHRKGKTAASKVSISENSSLTQENKGNEAPVKSQKNVIIYASRTHSQLSQVISELKNTRYRPKYALLASRDQFCINEKVTKNKSSVNINNACGQLTKKRQCFYRNNLEHFNAARIEGDGKSQPIMDIEELIAMGNKHNVCPFYYSRNSTEDADLILMPYNYLFDRDFRKAANINWNEAIVIFDEAHNLESFASEASSFDLSSIDIGGCILEVQKAIGIVTSGVSLVEDSSVSGTNLIKLKTIFLSLEEVLDSVPASGGSFSGDYIFEFLQRAQISYANHSLLLDFIKSVSDVILESRGGTTSGTPKLEHFASCIKKVFNGSDQAQCIAKSRVYRVHISPKMSASSGKSNMGQLSGSKERSLSYWCFAPSLAMNDLNNLGLRSIIVTSGTLSPMSSYSLELGLNFNVQLENPHIIKPNQVHVRVIGRGVSNKELKSTYDRRDDIEYLLEMGNTLCALAKIVPGGMLVFFPSYGVMDKCVEAWGGPSKKSTWLRDNGRNNSFFSKKKSKSEGGTNRYSFPRVPNHYGSSNIKTWQRMLSHKSIVLEPKSTNEMKDAIDEFDKYINTKSGNGCILMGVTRGKISEGIDFANGRARAVIITGLPFPPLHDQKVKLKREFLDGIKASASVRPTGMGGFDDSSMASQRLETISGSEWYSQQAHRAINQAVGRVIRHRFDYGAIILMDSRFGDARNQEGLSKWVRPSVQADEGIGKAISGLVSFFKEAEADPDLSGAPLSNDTVYKKIEGINLAYEKEKKERVLQNKEIEREKMPIEIAIVNENSENGESFVKPEQIVERIVVKNGYKQVKIKSNISVTNDFVDESSGLSAIYETPAPKPSSKVAFTSFGGQRDIKSTDNAWNIEGQENKASKKSVKVFNRASSLSLSKTITTGDKSSNGNRIAATTFFKLAKEKLSQDDFLVCRSLITNMRAFGDQNDSKSYIVAATDLVGLLLKYDDGNSRMNLLALFYPLLPTRHRGTIQAIATTARAKNVKKTNERLMNRKPDEKIQSVLFKRSTLQFKPNDESNDVASDENALNAVMNEHEKRNALMIASELRSSNQKRVAEFMSSRFSEDNRQNTMLNRKLHIGNKDQNSSKFSNKGLKRSSARALSMVGTNKRDKSEASEEDPILNTLEKAQSASFKSQKVSSIKYNAPSTLFCQICHTRMKRPLLASCGHSACQSCWDSWLNRNSQCPVCRKETKREDLAHMVFKPSDKDVPTLSQICNDEANGSESSDDELELTNN